MPTTMLWAHRIGAEKAKRLLGYEPSTPIEAGIEKFSRWFKLKAEV